MLSTGQHRDAHNPIMLHASKSKEQTDARRWRRTAILFVVRAVARSRAPVAVGVGLRGHVDVRSGGIVTATPMAAAMISAVVTAMVAAVISAAAMTTAVTGGQRGAGADCEGAYRDCQSNFG